MNNKGQTLVIFVIILPILLMVFTLIVDLGLLHIEKRKIDNIVYDSVEYYLDNINDLDIENKVNNLINKNINEIKIDINENDEYIEINVYKQRKGVYSIINNDTDIEISYKGFKENKKIIKG